MQELKVLEGAAYLSCMAQGGRGAELIPLGQKLRQQLKFWDERFAPQDWKEYQKKEEGSASGKAGGKAGDSARGKASDNADMATPFSSVHFRR